jgi:hypothetical protein
LDLEVYFAEHWNKRNTYGMWLLGRSRARWEDNIRKDVREIGCENWGLLEFKLFVILKAVLSGSLVTTAWHVLRLRMEEMASRYGG